MIFTLFLLVVFVKNEAYAKETVEIPMDTKLAGPGVVSKGTLDSKVDLQRKLRSTFAKLMDKTGVNKMEHFIKVEVSTKSELQADWITYH